MLMGYVYCGCGVTLAGDKKLELTRMLGTQ